MPVDLKEPGFSKSEIHESSRTTEGATRQALAPVLDRARQVFGGLQNSATEGVQRIESYVKQSPVKALALALAAAAVAGLALSGRFKRSPKSGDDRPE